jgi:predicted RecB family nuclease
MRPMRRQDDRLVFSPSDLNAFLACPHLTSLELAVAREQLERPFRPNPYADLIRRKGDEHEAAYLASLGDGVLAIGDPQEIGWDEAGAATEQAIRDGARFIYQAALVDGQWRGLADFLEPKPGGGYEVVDTKLARRAKPSHLLQLCFYTEQLARIQDRWPDQMHVVNGLGERESFRPQDFLAYYRRLKARFLDAVENERPTYPYPVNHCSLCEFLAPQMFFFRPAPGWSQYRTPIDGYYQCGSGTHPGGCVMGAPGKLAAGQILKDRARKTSRAGRAVPVGV